MWAAQYFQFNKPNSWITSGGLGDNGIMVLPAAIGAQMANPKKLLVIDIAGEASIPYEYSRDSNSGSI